MVGRIEEVRNPHSGWVLGGLWLLATLGGGILGLSLSIAVDFAVSGLLPTDSAGIPNNLADLLVIFLDIILIGGLTGLLQARVIQARIPAVSSSRWALAMIAGWFIGLVIYGAYSSFFVLAKTALFFTGLTGFSPASFSPIVWVIWTASMLFGGLVAGFAAGAIQWRTLRRHLAVPARWVIGIRMGSFALGLAAGQLLLWSGVGTLAAGSLTLTNPLGDLLSGGFTPAGPNASLFITLLGLFQVFLVNVIGTSLGILWLVQRARGADAPCL